MDAGLGLPGSPDSPAASGGRFVRIRCTCDFGRALYACVRRRFQWKFPIFIKKCPTPGAVVNDRLIGRGQAGERSERANRAARSNPFPSSPVA
jgi:hypothetical protein